MRFFKSLLLKPLSVCYGLIIKMRHDMYDRGFFSSTQTETPVIKIGNLSMGGTGKSPMTIYLAESLLHLFEVHVISRGYGRKSSGYVEVEMNSSPDDVGDEPLMIKKRVPMAHVHVSESRLNAIARIQPLEAVKKKIYLLDDAIQHRPLAGGFQILLTEAQRLFCDDELIPLGTLRDMKERAAVVDAIIVTKLNHTTDKEEVIRKIRVYSNTKILFSEIVYLPYRNFFTVQEYQNIDRVIVVSAIADARLFEAEVSRKSKLEYSFRYRDHYCFKPSDCDIWIKVCKKYAISHIITTEKDAMKMSLFQERLELENIQLLILPIRIQMTEEDNTILFDMLNQFIINCA